MKPFLYSGAAIACLTFVFLSFKKTPAFNDPEIVGFYYSYEKKVYLFGNSQRVVITFDTLHNADEFNAAITAITPNYTKQALKNSLIVELTSEGDRNTLLKNITNNSRVRHATQMFKDEHGMEIGFTDEILVKFKEAVTERTKDSLCKIFNLKRVEANRIFERLSIQRLKDSVLKIANKIQETGLVQFCHPDLVIKKTFCNYIPNDTYFDKQFYLHNTGQVINDGRSGTSGADIKAPGAWEITKGSNNIVVAVLDAGVTANHPDLPNSRQVRLPGSNFYGPNPNDPSPNAPIDQHGNLTAGIIAATQDNNEGVSGVAPNCKIMPINIGGLDVTFVNTSVISSAIELARANGADVINIGFVTTGLEPDRVPAIVDAIRTATQTGRNGKGCVVVCPNANAANNALPGPNPTCNGGGGVYFPANVLVDGVITVGASDRYDLQANYSPCGWEMATFVEYNPYIDIVAPSHRAYPNQIAGESFEVWTIDNPNTDGQNPYPNDSRFLNPPAAGEQLPNFGNNVLYYTGRYGGTSAAAPQVSGAAALILSLYPDLTQIQVYNLLIGTADKVGGYNYNYYVSNPSFPGRSREMGYGRLNACKVLGQTLKNNFSLAITGDDIVCNTSGTYSLTGFPSGSVLTWTVTPIGVATITQSNNQATLTKITDGVVKLNATSCSGETILKSKTVTIGGGIGGYYKILSNYHNCPGCENELYSNNSPIWLPANQPFEVQIYITNPGVNSVGWSQSGYPFSFTTLENGKRLNFSGVSASQAYTSRSVTFNATSSTSCGAANFSFSFSIVTQGWGFRMNLSPNPAKGNLSVEIDDESQSKKDKTFNPITFNLYNAGTKILVKRWRLNAGQKKYNLNIVGVKAGYYVVEAISGNNKAAKQILIIE